MQAKTETSAPLPEANSVIFYNFEGVKPWDHSAVQLSNSYYLSVHPITHFNPPKANEFHDPDDTSTKVLELWNNVVKPITYIQMDFGKANEELRYVHSAVKIDVTQEQFSRAEQAISKQIQDANQRLQHYSVFKFFGKSCAESSQQLLEIITANTPEQPLAKRYWFEHIVTWPQLHFERVKKVAQARRGEANPLPTPVSQKGLFAPSRGITTPSDHMEIERLTYF